MLDLDPKIKKKKGPAFFELDESLDHEWIREHQAYLVEEQRQKIKKKFEKDNQKRAAEGEREMKAKELEERLEAAKELEAKFKRENKTKKVEAEGKGITIEKLENQLLKLSQRIENMSLQAEDKENNKEVALGTSKIVSFSPPHMPGLNAHVSNIELHRPPSHRGVFEKVQCSHRKILLKDLA